MWAATSTIGERQAPHQAWGTNLNATEAYGELMDPEGAWVSARVFVDPAIYQQELERVFARSWLFVAHESELPRPGTFVTRWMGEDPVIVCRGADGQLRVLLNVCRHRGRRVCGEDLGQTAQFRCPYHGWTYDTQGRLVGVPFLDSYQGRLDTASLGLVAAPRVATYHGLVFASWRAESPDLVEYLGPMAWMFDVLFGRSDAMDVVGPPMRWVAGANWKLGAANFAGDAQHVFTTHGYVKAVGATTPRSPGARGYAVFSETGHLASLGNWPPDTPYGQHLALPEDLWPEIARHLTRDQFEVMRRLRVIAGNAFPNFSFLETSSPGGEEWGGDDRYPAMSFLTIRQWQPKGPDQMEVWSWQLIDRNAPEDWKQASRECYLREFGMGGTFEQDDLENWVSISGALRGPMARRLPLQYHMGMDVPPPTEWPGPGLAYVGPPFGELNERLFYRSWFDHMRGQT